MMRKLLHILFLLLISWPSLGQMERYTSTDNAYYWKNRKPYEGYWQQDVYYNIKANINEQTNIITGYEELTYKNNSNDTLSFVFFHLYQNAFQPGSYLHDLTKSNNVKPRYGKYESQGLNIKIDGIKSLSINSHGSEVELKYIIDNTIMKVMLPEGLLPGAEIKFAIHFKTYYDNGSQRRRMQLYNAWGYKHYNGCQWFPKISVYDKKIGWDTYQHLGREFYGDFGNFDVELTFANNFVVEATGLLTNEKEVLPDELRKKLDIKNFTAKPADGKPSVITAPDGTTKTWKYHAENVHDFAFTADPTYRLGETEWNGIKCIAIAQEPHCYGWQNAAEYTAKIIEVYSTDIGMYAYPKMVVADARDGMEYPMITMDGGTDPGYRGLFCHEIGHNWFYAMVGSNETYRALLDEGFTQFLTGWSLTKLEGDEIKNEPKWYQPKTSEPLTQRYSSVYSTYLNAAINDEDGYINTHSDMFNGALGHGGGYGMVYRKTGTMLYNLQYVLGDELFLKAMQHYFNQWKFCHPYPEDFRNSITEVVKYDLNWFFDQWLETDKKLDYKVCNAKRGDSTDTYTIKFKRNGRMQSPIDFTVYSNCGAKYDYHIPNTWFTKQTDATVLPKWEGWDNLRDTYKATVKIPCGIGNVVIDTSYRLADINQLNNSLYFPVKLIFDKWQKPAFSDWKHYVFYARPDVWYNSYDGIKAGVHVESNYMKVKHIFSGDLWLNTAIGRGKVNDGVNLNKNDAASIRLFYKTQLTKLYPKLNVWINGASLDGLNRFQTGLEIFTPNMKTRVFTEYKLMHRNNETDLAYLLYPGEWQADKFNNTLTLGVTRSFACGKIYGYNTLKTTTNSIYSDYDFTTINFTNISTTTTGKIDWRTRFFIQFGNGNNIPNESALYVAGANPEELMDNAYTRSAGFVPKDWTGYGVETNHFQHGGGLNLRGYAGYLIPLNEGANQSYLYKGTSGASVSVELDFDRLINFKPAFTRNWLGMDLYLFADAGTISTNNPAFDPEFSRVRMDAGIGSTLTIKKWGPFNAIKPLTLRFDVPLFLNSPPTEDDYVQMRFVVGVGRTF